MPNSFAKFGEFTISMLIKIRMAWTRFKRKKKERKRNAHISRRKQLE